LAGIAGLRPVLADAVFFNDFFEADLPRDRAVLRAAMNDDLSIQMGLSLRFLRRLVTGPE
jgi:hypothetical protein